MYQMMHQAPPSIYHGSISSGGRHPAMPNSIQSKAMMDKPKDKT